MMCTGKIFINIIYYWPQTFFKSSIFSIFTFSSIYLI